MAVQMVSELSNRILALFKLKKLRVENTAFTLSSTMVIVIGKV